MSILTRLFGDTHAKEETETLIEEASHSSGAKKVAAIRSLGKIENDKRVPEYYIRCLQKAYDEYQKDSMTLTRDLNAVVAAIEELGKFKDERAVPILTEWATYGFLTVVITAAENALGKSTPPPAHRHENLFYAIVAGDTEEVQRLLDEGADLRTVNLFGQTPLDVACESGNQEIIRLVTAKGGTRNP